MTQPGNMIIFLEGRCEVVVNGVPLNITKGITSTEIDERPPDAVGAGVGSGVNGAGG